MTESPTPNWTTLTIRILPYAAAVLAFPFVWLWRTGKLEVFILLVLIGLVLGGRMLPKRQATSDRT